MKHTLKVIRSAYYGPDCDWEEKDEITVTLTDTNSWKAQLSNPQDLQSIDARTFEEQDKNIIDHWASLSESLDGPYEAVVYYIVESAEDSQQVRQHLITQQSTS